MYKDGDMTKQSANLFECPACRARYKLVRMACDRIESDEQIACRNCGAPLQARDGNDILKYFLVGQRRYRRPGQHCP